MRTFLLLVFLMCVVPTARADDNQVAVVVAGDATTDLAASLEAWLGDHGHKVVASPFPASAIKEIGDCFVIENDACARVLVEKHANAIAVLVIRTRSDKAKSVSLTGYWFQGGREAVADQRLCDPCSDDTLRNAARELAAGLSRSHQRAVGRLRVTSTPSGAIVHLDGQSIGVTPLDYDVAPGNHQVTLTADRHAVETRTIAMRAGETTKLDVPLEPHAELPRTSRALPLSIMVGGGLVAIAGGIVFSVDEDHLPDAGPYIRDTAPYGVAMIAAGGAAIAVGTWMLLRRPRSSAPVAFVDGDSGYIGWVSKF